MRWFDLAGDLRSWYEKDHFIGHEQSPTRDEMELARLPSALPPGTGLAAIVDEPVDQARGYAKARAGDGRVLTG